MNDDVVRWSELGVVRADAATLIAIGDWIREPGKSMIALFAVVDATLKTAVTLRALGRLGANDQPEWGATWKL